MNEFRLNTTKTPRYSEEENDSSSFQRNHEVQLWNSFRNGADSAFVKIYETFFPILFNYGHQFTRDTDLIKDSIQEFFIELRNNRTRLGETTSVKAYFFKSIRRKLVKTLSKRRNILYNEQLERDFDFEISLSSETILIENQIKSEQMSKLEGALSHLTKRQKEAIIYFYYDGLSYEEIASIMNLSKIKYARTLIYRSIDKLKDKIG